jgi:hypothetical protein
LKILLIIISLLLVLNYSAKSQDTTHYVVGYCLLKNQQDTAPCPPGINFNYFNDTLEIFGTIQANCCGTHLAIIHYINTDTIIVHQVDTGYTCDCDCEFCFEIFLPVSQNDSFVVIKGHFYNIQDIIHGIRSDQYISSSIQIFPTPADNLINIRLISELDHIENIVVSDFVGKAISKINCFNKNEIVVDLANLKGGIYLMSFTTTEGKIFTRKFVIK